MEVSSREGLGQISQVPCSPVGSEGYGVGLSESRGWGLAAPGQVTFTFLTLVYHEL
jgi:hypothetical protein